MRRAPRTFRIAVTAGLGLSLVVGTVSACSTADALPSRSEFVSRMDTASHGTVDAQTAGCIYDKMSADHAELRNLFDHPGTLDTATQKLIRSCIGLG